MEGNLPSYFNYKQLLIVNTLYTSIHIFQLPSSFVVERCRYLNKNTKALADLSPYIRVKLCTLIGYN